MNDTLSSLLKEGTTLLEHQKEFLKWATTKEFRGGILADEMGLGKTLQMLSYCMLLAEKKEDCRFLIVCPVNALHVWRDELNKHFAKSKLTTCIYCSENGYKLNPKATFVITNYEAVLRDYKLHVPFAKQDFQHYGSSYNCEVLVNKIEKKYPSGKERAQIHQALNVKTEAPIVSANARSSLFSKSWSCLILDEGHIVRNHLSKTCKAIRMIHTEEVWILSGTPLQNNVSDIFTALALIRYPDNGYIYIKNKMKRPDLKKVKDDLKLVMLRRTKKELAQRDKEAGNTESEFCKLGEKLEFHLSQPFQHVEEKTAYNLCSNAVRDIATRMENERQKRQQGKKTDDMKSQQALLFEAITRMRLCCIAPCLADAKLSEDGWSGVQSTKMLMLCDYIKNKLGPNEKLIIISTFVKALDLAAKAIKSVYQDEIVFYKGGMKIDRRSQVIDEFMKNKKTRIMMLSMKAGGTAITLTSAGRVFIFDPWWNPGAEEQSIARAHRIGQHNTVTVTWPIITDTIENIVVNVSSGKRDLASNLIDRTKMRQIATPQRVNAYNMLNLLRQSGSVSRDQQQGIDEESDYYKKMKKRSNMKRKADQLTSSSNEEEDRNKRFRGMDLNPEEAKEIQYIPPSTPLYKAAGSLIKPDESTPYTTGYFRNYNRSLNLTQSCLTPEGALYRLLYSSHSAFASSYCSLDRLETNLYDVDKSIANAFIMFEGREQRDKSKSFMESLKEFVDAKRKEHFSKAETESNSHLSKFNEATFQLEVSFTSQEYKDKSIRFTEYDGVTTGSSNPMETSTHKQLLSLNARALIPWFELSRISQLKQCFTKPVTIEHDYHVPDRNVLLDMLWNHREDEELVTFVCMTLLYSSYTDKSNLFYFQEDDSAVVIFTANLVEEATVVAYKGNKLRELCERAFTTISSLFEVPKRILLPKTAFSSSFMDKYQFSYVEEGLPLWMEKEGSWWILKRQE